MVPGKQVAPNNPPRWLFALRRCKPSEGHVYSLVVATQQGLEVLDLPHSFSGSIKPNCSQIILVYPAQSQCNRNQAAGADDGSVRFLRCSGGDRRRKAGPMPGKTRRSLGRQGRRILRRPGCLRPFCRFPSIRPRGSTQLQNLCAAGITRLLLQRHQPTPSFSQEPSSSSFASCDALVR